VKRLADAARNKGCAVHLDGARLANAVAAGFDPKAISRLGIDMLVLGGTKAGMPPTEAVVILNKALARRFDARLKQSGQLPSKGRFYAAPFIGMLQDGALGTPRRSRQRHGKPPGGSHAVCLDASRPGQWRLCGHARGRPSTPDRDRLGGLSMPGWIGAVHVFMGHQARDRGQVAGGSGDRKTGLVAHLATNSPLKVLQLGIDCRFRDPRGKSMPGLGQKGFETLFDHEIVGHQTFRTLIRVASSCARSCDGW